MENTECEQLENLLETEAIGKLILKYPIPAIASRLVGSLYNIIDQIFVGNSIGELGNAATNVAFPIVVVAALAITFPLIWGIDGVLWAGPVADGLAGIISLLLVRHEMNRWKAAPN